jgi:regulator of nonsense transcripts 2
LRTFEQAAAATDELFALEHDSNAADDAESDDERPSRGNQAEADEPVEELDEIEPEHQSDQVEDEDQDQDQEVVLIRDSKKDEIDEEAAADFDREFAKMMADTTDARRGDSRRAPPPVFDTAIPHVKKREEREAAEGRMSFTLLSKRGNRQQVSHLLFLSLFLLADGQMRSLDIPMDSNIAVNLQNYQQQSLAERQQLKRLVLQNEARQEQSEVQCEYPAI